MIQSGKTDGFKADLMNLLLDLMGCFQTIEQ